MLRSGLILMIRQKAQAGQSPYAIGKDLNISKNTAKKYVDGENREHRLKGRTKASKLDPFKPKIVRWYVTGYLTVLSYWNDYKNLDIPAASPLSRTM